MSGLVADKTKGNIQNYLVLDFKEGKNIYLVTSPFVLLTFDLQ